MSLYGAFFDELAACGERPDVTLFNDPSDPQTPEEWQESVDLANLFLHIDSAVKYGLIIAPPVNVDRCADILRRGAERGVRPSREVGELLQELLQEARDDE